MKRLNKKGFSLVELLAVVVILGILATIGIGAYNYYSNRARMDSTDYLGKSAISAAESYVLDHPGAQKVDLATLVELDYLENDNDPGTNDHCKGSVSIAVQKSTVDSQINDYNIVANICCSTGNFQYDNNGGKEKTDICQADVEMNNFVAPPSVTNCTGSAGTVVYFLEPTDFVSDCEQDASGNYAQCKDAYGNYPCRIYEYHTRSCICRTKTIDSVTKLCYATVSASNVEDYTAKIYYNNNAKGRRACAEESNSYVKKAGNVIIDNSYGGVFAGYPFSTKEEKKYTNFQPKIKVYHATISSRIPFDNNINTVKRYKSDGSIDYEAACTETCKLYLACK